MLGWTPVHRGLGGSETHRVPTRVVRRCPHSLSCIFTATVITACSTGQSKIPDLIQRVKSLGMPAVALTDHGNLFGAIEFFREAKAAGSIPIVGIEAYVAPGKRTDRTTSSGGAGDERYAYHLTLLAQNGVGFRNLLRLSSRSYQEGYYYKPRIDKEILAQHSEGLICLSGCVGSEFSQLLLNDRKTEAENLAMWYYKTFGEGNFFVEVQNNGLQIQRDCMERELDVAGSAGTPGGGHQRRPLSDPGRLPGPRRLALHQHRPDDRPAAGQTAVRGRRRQALRPVPRAQARGDATAFLPGMDEALAMSARIADGDRGELRQPGPGQAAVPLVSGARGEDCRRVPARALRARPAAAVWRSAAARGPGAAGSRAGRDQADGLRLVFPDRLGLRPLRSRARHSGLGPRVGLRGDGQLRAAPEQRLPDQVRPPVRAVPRPQSLRGARYRHRPLPESPLRGDRVRPQEVRRRQRGPDWHLRHDEGQGGRSRTWAGC